MSDELPNPSDQEIVQMMAAQKTLMDNRALHNEYVNNVKELAEKYGVEVHVDGA